MTVRMTTRMTETDPNPRNDAQRPLRAGRPRPRFHCGSCGNPVAPGDWIRLAYGYEGRDRAYLACPSCFQTQHLLPSPPVRPPSRPALPARPRG